MLSEEVKRIKCDRCGVTIGLYTHDTGYRCPDCIWKEKEKLRICAERLSRTATPSSKNDPIIREVFSNDLKALKKAVEQAI